MPPSKVEAMSVDVDRPLERPTTLKQIQNVYETHKAEDADVPDPGRRGSQGVVDKSLAILSPFDEQEEWAKISEIMASFGTGLVRESVFVTELEQEFQSRLGMCCFYNFFYLMLKKYCKSLKSFIHSPRSRPAAEFNNKVCDLFSNRAEQARESGQSECASSACLRHRVA